MDNMEINHPLCYHPGLVGPLLFSLVDTHYFVTLAHTIVINTMNIMTSKLELYIELSPAFVMTSDSQRRHNPTFLFHLPYYPF